MTKDSKTRDLIEDAADTGVWAHRRPDLWRRIVNEAFRLATRKKYPAPDPKTAVEWASVRVMDADACYAHDTGAVRPWRMA
jgi:hypothetical protein